MRNLFILIIMTLVFSVSMVFAQDTVLDVNISLQIPSVFDLSWNVNGSEINLTGANAITPAEFMQGYKDGIPGGELKASANANYDMTVTANGDYFFGGSGGKHTSDISVSISGSDYIQLNGSSDINILNSHIPEVGNVKPVEYRIELNSDDTEGLYTTTITYTMKPSI